MIWARHGASVNRHIGALVNAAEHALFARFQEEVRWPIARH
jgi:hypothetical protein